MMEPGVALMMGLLLCGSAAASAESMPPWALTLADCVDRALRENVGLQVRRLDPEVTLMDVETAEAAFDVRMDASGTASETTSATASSELDGSEQPTSERQGGRASLAKRLATGTEIRLGTSVNKFKTDSLFSTLNPAIDAEASLELRQPLLKGAGKTVNRAAIVKAEIAVDRADERLRSAAMDVVRDVELTYWSLALARERLEVVMAAVESSNSLLEETRAKRGQGVMTRVDVLQARADLASKQEAVLVARQEIDDQEDQLLALLNAFDEAEGRGLDVEALPDQLPEQPEVERSLQRAIALQPEYRLLEMARREDQVDVDVARRQRLPTLDLLGRGGYSGRDDNYGGAYEGLSNRDGNSWEVNLLFEMPWGFRAERAGLRQAELRRLQGDLDLADVDIALLRDIRIGCRAVATGVARIGSTRVTRSLQEEQFAQERARYEAGLVTIRDTLIAQDNLNEARLRVLVAMRDTIEALIRLARLEGSLLEAHGIAWKTPDEEE